MLTIEVLTVEETQNLQEQEGRIEQGFRLFFAEVGDALRCIQEGRLYRASFSSFEDYCRDRWQIGRTYAYRLIEAAKTVSLLRSAGAPEPQNERQVRELLQLKDPQLQIEAWLEAVETSNGNPASQQVQEVVSQIKAQKAQQPITPGSKALVIHGNHRGKEVEVRRTDKGVAYATLPGGENYPFLTGELEVIEAAPVLPTGNTAKPKAKDLVAILEKVYTEVGGLISAELRSEIEMAIGITAIAD